MPGRKASLYLRLYNWGQGGLSRLTSKLPQLPWLAAAVCSNWHTRLAAAGFAIKLLPDGLEVQGSTDEVCRLTAPLVLRPPSLTQTQAACGILWQAHFQGH